jgi:hypothetical protein
MIQRPDRSYRVAATDATTTTAAAIRTISTIVAPRLRFHLAGLSLVNTGLIQFDVIALFHIPALPPILRQK